MPINYAPLPKDHVQRAYELESASYPSDEAASLTSLEYRQEHASRYFLAAYEDEELIGFICSTLTSSPTLTHESMETHEPSGEYLAIHSVCVSPDHRRIGIAKGLLREYIRRVREANEVRGIRLIAKEGLVGMYERSGFTSKGKSQVVHGQDPWFELGIDFQGKQESTETLSSPFEQSEDVDPASVRSPGKRLASATVTKAIVEEKLVEDGKNKFDLYCPRAECRCFLIRKGAASWVAKGSHKGDLELPPLPRRIDAPPRPSAASPHLGYWTLSSPLAFENIGFTRSLPPSSSHPPPGQAPPSMTTTSQIKYLTCADCDFGPLGWHDTEGRDLGVEVQEENEGANGQGGGGGGSVRKGREFLIDLDRVRYKV
ncbi:hypothetical protein JCM16303_006452 [Sporobolomyces ruberrimus]